MPNEGTFLYPKTNTSRIQRNGADDPNRMLRTSQAGIQSFHTGVDLLAQPGAKSEPAPNLKTNLVEHQQAEMPKTDSPVGFRVLNLGLKANHCPRHGT